MGLGRTPCSLRFGTPTLTAIAMALALAFCSTAIAQPSGDLDWFKRRWDLAASWEIPDNTYVEYTVETFYEVSEAEVRQIAREIEGHPQHPRRQEYARKQLLLESGGVVREDVRGWWTDRGWRLSRDIREGSDSGFTDTVVTARTAWRRTPDAMVLADPTESNARFDHWRDGVALREALVGFSIGGLGYEATTPIRYRPAGAERNADGGWIATIQDEEGARVKEIHGSTEGEYLLVDQIELVKSGGMPVIIDKRRRFSEWYDEEYLGRPVAHIVEVFDDQGTLRSRQTLRTLRQIDKSQAFGLVAAIPDEEHPDPIRDAMSPSVVTDARAGRETVTIEHEGAREVMPLPGAIPQQSRRALRYVGWTLLAVGVMVVVAWRIRRTAR
ncbi:MAG: hypothetical protein IT431_13555 [Phycisphaerales bacterium]|nr:hypothetical protein [Phycisphaerales bacterium]